jgi:chorismate synthase
MTAGESHGQALVAILEGLPSGIPVSLEKVNRELERRQLGYGRGKRMAIEKDQVKIISGIRHGQTIGSPIAVEITNRDWQHWQEVMAIEKKGESNPVTQPRPGHADLAGIIKTSSKDIRNILERASARETAARVAVGALAKQFLLQFHISIISHVLQIGSVKSTRKQSPKPKDLEEIDKSIVRCFDKLASQKMAKAIDEATKNKDTLGGVFEVRIFGLPIGLGSYTQWDQRLNANLARAIMSIPAIKGVEIGDGFALANLFGSQAHDEIFYHPKSGYYRKTNHAGGIEGGMSNGETIIVRAVMKPIPTLRSPLKTVDIITKAATLACKERSDICAVPSAAVIAESMAAIEIASNFLRKFSGDSLEETKRNFSAYLNSVKKR